MDILIGQNVFITLFKKLIQVVFVTNGGEGRGRNNETRREREIHE